MTLVADPQKKLTTTLLLRPKLRLKRGWPTPKKKEKDILKNQVFAEIYHDVVASEKTV